MNDTYLYPYSSAEARERNELSLWRESHKANIACRNAIEDAIRQSFDGMHLDNDCITPVLDEYGYEGGMLQQHKMGVIMAGELSAAKARLKLMLILSQYGPDGRPDPAEVARYFEHSM